jgi:hypothetical protein
MAILTTVGQGDSKFYEVPDDQLSKYELKTEQKKDDTSGESPEGKMPAALMSGGDVQAYSGDICWIRRGGVLYWWYC